MIVDCGTASTPIPGEQRCGDRAVIAAYDGGVLVGAIDGLGHGAEAEVAAVAAVQELEAAPAAPLEDLFARCHAKLRATRGAVLALAQLGADGRMRWGGVGNIDGMLLRGPASNHARREAMLGVGGIVGYSTPHLHARELEIYVGDTLVLATDGIRHGFAAIVTPARSPQAIADELVARWATGRDDACAVVARYRGAA